MGFGSQELVLYLGIISKGDADDHSIETLVKEDFQLKLIGGKIWKDNEL